jgi:hypothetical protein
LEEWIHGFATETMERVRDGSESGFAGAELRGVEGVFVSDSGVREDGAVEIAGGVVNVDSVVKGC